MKIVCTDNPFSPVMYWPDHFERTLYGKVKVKKISMRSIGNDIGVIERKFSLSTTGN